MPEFNEPIDLVESTDHATRIQHRDVSTLTFPALVFQPIKDNTRMAFDIMPKGTPVTGMPAWQDICDVDLIANPTAAVRMARIGISTLAAEFGSKSLSGGASTPTHLLVDGVAKVKITPQAARMDGAALGLGAAVARTIVSGAIAVTTSYHKIDTEGAAASDDLDTITGGSDGDTLTLRITANGRSVVVKHGTGNIKCGSDRTLNDVSDAISLTNRDGTGWSLQYFADNA